MIGRVRSKAVYDDGEFLIPGEFYRSVKPGDLDKLCDDRGVIADPKHKRRLFKLMGLTVPKGDVRILVCQQDLEAMIEQELCPPPGHA